MDVASLLNHNRMMQRIADRRWGTRDGKVVVVLDDAHLTFNLGLSNRLRLRQQISIRSRDSIELAVVIIWDDDRLQTFHVRSVEFRQ